MALGCPAWRSLAEIHTIYRCALHKGTTMNRPRRSRLMLVVVLLLLLSYFGLPSLPSLPGHRSYYSWDDEAYLLSKNLTSVDACKALPIDAFDKVQVVLKIGAGEVESKLPVHLRTVTSCVPNLLIFSDFEETAHGHNVIDALENFGERYEHDNPDFRIYDTIKQQKASGQRVGKSGDGWRLDKYKFFPMMEITWQKRDQKDWYVFIELDTYVVWDNLLRFLGHLDPEQPLYMGSPVWPPKKPVFGHGGSGLILSRNALGELASHGRNFRDEYSIGNHQFGQDMKEECCGDEVLAKVFYNIGITLKGYWPLINGESTLR